MTRVLYTAIRDTLAISLTVVIALIMVAGLAYALFYGSMYAVAWLIWNE